MKVFVKLMGKGTMDDPIRPVFHGEVSYIMYAFDKDAMVGLVEINDKDYDKIKQYVVDYDKEAKKLSVRFKKLVNKILRRQQ